MRKFLEIMGGITIIMILVIGIYAFLSFAFNESDKTLNYSESFIIASVDTPTANINQRLFPMEYIDNMGDMYVLQDTFTTIPDTIVFVQPTDYIMINNVLHKRLTGRIAIKNVSEFNILFYSNDSENWTRIYPNGGSDSWNPIFEDTLFFKSKTGSVPTEIIYFLPRWTGK